MRYLLLTHGEIKSHKGYVFTRHEPIGIDDHELIEFLLSLGTFLDVTHQITDTNNPHIHIEDPVDVLEDETESVEEIEEESVDENPSSGAITSDFLEGIEEIKRGEIKEQKNELGEDDLDDKWIMLKRVAAIGDTVYVATVAQQIKNKFPGCHIGIVVRDEFIEFAGMFPYFDEILTLVEASKFENINRYDYIIQYDGVIEDRPNNKDDRDYFELHFSKLGSSWEAKETFEPLVIHNSAIVMKYAQDELLKSGIGNDPYVLLVTGTSNPLKTLTSVVVEEIIKKLTIDQDNDPRVRVVVVCGKRDRIPRKIEDNDWAYLCYNEPLCLISELAKRATAVFGCDTGLTQLSAAMGVPTISYWGPTDPSNSIKHYPGSKDEIQADVICSPCKYVMTAYCDKIQGGIPECMRQVVAMGIVERIKKVYNEVSKVPIVDPDKDDDGEFSTPERTQFILQTKDVSQFLNPKHYSVALLLDNTSIFTGGGFYAWQQAIMLSKRSGIDVFVFVDTNEPVYLGGEGKLPSNFYVVQDNQLGNWGISDCAKLSFDLVMGTPPYQGMNAVAAQSESTKVALLVYETPDYIKRHRPGVDGEEPYWSDYRRALLSCDHIFTISKTVKAELLSWIPEVKGKIVNILPVCRTDIADPIIGDIDYRLDPQHRTNSVVLISRNQKYKDLSNAVMTIINTLGAAYSYDDDPFIIHIIGQGSNVLAKSFSNHTNETLKVIPHENLWEAEKWKLISKAKLLVHPSIFEGFGIPIAEALYAATPVMCRHLEVYQDCFKNHPTYYIDEKDFHAKADNLFQGWDTEELQKEHTKKLRDGWRYVNNVYTMTMGYERLKSFLNFNMGDDLEEASEVVVQEKATETTLPRVAIISTWNSKCGIAETTRAWLRHAGFAYKVFAPKEPDIKIDQEDGGNVTRCWDKNFSSYNELLERIIEFKPDIVHIQHEHSFFGHGRGVGEVQLYSFMSDLKTRGFKVVITLHTYEATKFLDDMSEKVDIIVTTKPQVDERIENMTSIGLPIEEPNRITVDEARQKLGWSDKPRYIVGSFGMWGHHKGYGEFLDTYAMVSPRIRDVDLKYMIVGFRQSNNEYARTIIRQRMSMQEDGFLALFQEYLSSDDVMHKLCAANTLVFNYITMSHSSASAAIRTGMAAGRPIVCTHSAMFEEFEDNKHVLKVPFGDLSALTNAVVTLSRDDTLRKELVKNCDIFVEDNQSDKIAQRHLELYENLMKEKDNG